MKTFHALVAALALSLGGAALAHDDATLDKMKTPNGGQLRAAGAQHYELVLAAPGQSGPALPVAVYVTDHAGAKLPVAVYVTDHAGAKLPVAGASGIVTVLAGGRKTTITLQPAGDNVLKGSGAYVPGPDLKAVVSVALPGQPAGQARFEPFAGAHTH